VQEPEYDDDDEDDESDSDDVGRKRKAAGGRASGECLSFLLFGASVCSVWTWADWVSFFFFLL
jgi:hypothetical protein